MSLFNTLTIRESQMVEPGRPVHFRVENVLVMHPLDVIAVTEPDALVRLDRAMDWVLERAHHRLDAAADALWPDPFMLAVSRGELTHAEARAGRLQRAKVGL